MIVRKNAFLLVFTAKGHRKRSEIPHFSEHFVLILRSWWWGIFNPPHLSFCLFERESNIYLLFEIVRGGNIIPTLNELFTVHFGTARKKNPWVNLTWEDKNRIGDSSIWFIVITFSVSVNFTTKLYIYFNLPRRCGFNPHRLSFACLSTNLTYNC